MEWVLDNWGLVLTIAFAVLGAFKGTDLFRYIRAVKRIAKAAWRVAEEEGILGQIKGAQKAAPFLQTFFDMWEKHFGTTPSPVTQALAMKVAAEESVEHKIERLADPKS